MIDEAKKSLKAKLYDLTYSPFMSSLIVAWTLLNHKYILIYFSHETIANKITLLNQYDFTKKIFNYISINNSSSLCVYISFSIKIFL